MKVRYQYRIYPTSGQQSELAKLFGCCRVVWNEALALVKSIPQGEKWPKNSELQRLVITQAKQDPGKQWLSEVSVVALQQSVIDLGTAFKNFFESRSGKRKGPRIKFLASRSAPTSRQPGLRSVVSPSRPGKSTWLRLGTLKPSGQDRSPLNPVLPQSLKTMLVDTF